METNTERKTWVIPADKWHARLYRAWRAVASFKASGNYKENLCHYWRVVIFWAPVTLFCKWFFLNKTPKKLYNYDDVPPAVWTLLVLTPMMLIFLAYSTMTWQGATATVVGAPLASAAAIAICLKTEEWHKNRRRRKIRALMYDEQTEDTEDNRNLLFEVLRAKKHKVCPFIEIENVDYNG